MRGRGAGHGAVVLIILGGSDARARPVQQRWGFEGAGPPLGSGALRSHRCPRKLLDGLRGCGIPSSLTSLFGVTWLALQDQRRPAPWPHPLSRVSYVCVFLQRWDLNPGLLWSELPLPTSLTPQPPSCHMGAWPVLHSRPACEASMFLPLLQPGHSSSPCVHLGPPEMGSPRRDSPSTPEVWLGPHPSPGTPRCSLPLPRSPDLAP